MTADTPSVTNEDKDREKSLLTSLSESHLEKNSPAPGSISPDTSIPSNKPKSADDTDNDDSQNVTDDETEYPPTATKIGVGIGLSLVVFLVRLTFFATWTWLTCV